ncbi:hypothetical protein Gotri_005501 [Gossypium trilobum]|uniref:DUF4283 domain-containing protein n=1 Tax=Gossypium trilobum TaxID=34281 RepID=A0A7J9EX93_9ROSI|nr:hypothetical protein [Gossypium trilobum]
MEEELANLNNADDDEELVQAFDDEDYAEEDFNICLVGRVLMDSIVHFPSMRNFLANLWHPIEGIFITEIEDKRILFKFYNKEVAFGWDISLRSPLWRATTTTSKWLQEELVEAGNSRMDWEENRRVRLHENPYVQGHNGGNSNSDSEERSFGLVDGRKRQRSHRLRNPNQRNLSLENIKKNCELSTDAISRLTGHNENLKLECPSMERIRKSCKFGNKIDVGANGSRGGLSLGWNKGISVTLRSFFHSHIDVEVKKEYGKILWRLTSFYGSPVENQRKDS